MTKLMWSALLPISVLVWAVACGDSTGDGDDEDDGSGNSGTGNSGNSGTGNSGNSGTGNSGNSGTGVADCAELCALAPVDSATGDCVADYMVLQGYDFATTECANTNNEPGCLACYGAVDVSDGDCVAVHAQCF